MKDPRTIVHRAVITEKGSKLRTASNQFLFIVDPASNKIEIAAAVEKIFNVKVTGVRTMNRLGKPKTMGRYQGKRSSWKKAVITLAAGQTIEVFDSV